MWEEENWLSELGHWKVGANCSRARVSLLLPRVEIFLGNCKREFDLNFVLFLLHTHGLDPKYLELLLL